MRCSWLMVVPALACTPVDDAPSVARVVDAAVLGTLDGPMAWNPDLGPEWRPDNVEPPPAAEGDGQRPAAAEAGPDADVDATRPPATADAPPGPTGPRITRWPVARRVVIVSVDGLRADALSTLRVPTFDALRREGASTLNARTDPGRTVTLPNHTCMITSRPTDGPDGHGFTGNGVTDATLHEIHGSYVASLFDVAHDRGLHTAMVAAKPKFSLYGNSYDAAHGAPDLEPPDDGPAKLDVALIEAYDDDATLGHALELLAGGRTEVIFIHWHECDSAGHSTGFNPAAGTPYAAAVERQDARLGRLRAALDPDTALVVTTDHGGSGYGHSDPALREHYTIPFLVAGPGVAAGADLYALNAGQRAEPGIARAAEDEPPPIRNCEAGNLALSLLNLPPIPGSVIGRAALHLRWGR
ncbi:MAG: alkaline phosphatase family protein [bacterium]